MPTVITVGAPPGIPPDLDPTTPGTQPSIVVYVKEVWDSTKAAGRHVWREAPYLQAISATESIGNVGVGRAEFQFDYGQMLREDTSAYANAAHSDVVPGAAQILEINAYLLNKYVRITAFAVGGRQPQRHANRASTAHHHWHGIFTADSLAIMAQDTTDSADVPTGVQRVVAFTLDAMLDTITIDRGHATRRWTNIDANGVPRATPTTTFPLGEPLEDPAFEPDEIPDLQGTAPAIEELDRPLPFNVRHGNAIVGNRAVLQFKNVKDRQLEESDIFAHGREGDSVEWRHEDIVNHILHYAEARGVERMSVMGQQPGAEKWPTFRLQGQVSTQFEAPPGANLPTGTTVQRGLDVPRLPSPLYEIITAQDLTGLTVRQALNRLIDPRRGVGWVVRTTGTGFIGIHIFSTSNVTLTLDDPLNPDPTTLRKIPGNPQQVVLRIDERGEAPRRDVTISVTESKASEYGEVVVQGPPMLSCFALSPQEDLPTFESGFVPGWTKRQERVYRFGANTGNMDYFNVLAHPRSSPRFRGRTSRPQLNDIARNADVLESVYTHFVMPVDWDGKVIREEAGNTPWAAFPKFDDNGIMLLGPNGLPVPQTTALQELRFERRIPLRDGIEYSAEDISDDANDKHEPMLPIPFIEYEEGVGPVWRDLSRLPNNAISSNASVRPLSDRLGFEIRTTPSHALAGDDWDGGFTLGGDLDIAPDGTQGGQAGSYELVLLHVAGINVDDVAGGLSIANLEHGPFVTEAVAGILTHIGNGTFTWLPAGALSDGPSVTINPGETKDLHGPANFTQHHITLKRNPATTTVTGSSALVTLQKPFNAEPSGNFRRDGLGIPFQYRWRLLQVVVAARGNERPRIRKTIGSPDDTQRLKRVKTITVPTAELWYVVPGTPYRLVSGSVMGRTISLARVNPASDGILRDPFPRLRAIATVAKTYYESPRRIVNARFNQWGLFAPPGSMLNTITETFKSQSGFPQPINTVVVRRSWDYGDVIRTEIDTDFLELDLSLF